MEFFESLVVIRYPWGSGNNAETRSRDFLGTIDDLKGKGLSEKEIAVGLDLRTDKGQLWNTTDFRAARSIAQNQRRQADINRANYLKTTKGYSNVAVGKAMGLNESTVRSLLEPGAKDRVDILQATTNMLRDQIDQKKYVDVGAGSAVTQGVTETRFKTAIAALKEEGYTLHYVKVQQLGTGKFTTQKVMAGPKATYKEVYQNRDQIKPITDFTPDGGRTFFGIQKPLDISADRVGVRYAEQGGKAADGVIFVRPGKDDLSLGKSNYAQVRISVNGTHYLKGMAMYRDDLPDGVDLLFNTNKSDTGNKLDAFKKLKDDPDNPFGAVVRQLPKLDEHGTEIKNTVRSAMNIVNAEGDWDTWSKSLSSQFLSKQSPVLAKTQLAADYEGRKSEFDEINSLTNPAVKKKLLDSFADDVDSAAVHLKAAALPRQSTRVILPVETLKDTEVYAPSFRNGERVVLVRHPHGGTFELPELTVNNNHPEAKRLLGTSPIDAIGINSRVAERLSGADFDGDQVLVIPNNQGRVKTSPALEGLKNFDAKSFYPAYDGMRTIDGGTYNAKTKEVEYGSNGKYHNGTGKGMGDISNLITDMTIKGANTTELAAAVRHSMVVIDAEKHRLDYKSSEIDNNIRHLKAKYQPVTENGRSRTLISQAGSRKDVAERKQGFRTDPESGRKLYRETGDTYTDKNGKLVVRTQRSTKLAETTDAHTLSSGTPIEKVYGDYSNNLKDLANQARLESLNTAPLQRSPSASKVYASEVTSLDSKLAVAEKNAPLERHAQVLANAVVKAKQDANPDMDKDSLKKIKAQALAEQRVRVGAKKTLIDITDREWEAIQNGAISNSKLKRILNNADLDKVKARATPRTRTVMTPDKISRARQLLANGGTQSAVADQLGVNLSTLRASLKEEGE